MAGMNEPSHTPPTPQSPARRPEKSQRAAAADPLGFLNTYHTQVGDNTAIRLPRGGADDSIYEEIDETCHTQAEKKSGDDAMDDEDFEQEFDKAFPVLKYIAEDPSFPGARDAFLNMKKDEFRLSKILREDEERERLAEAKVNTGGDSASPAIVDVHGLAQIMNAPTGFSSTEESRHPMHPSMDDETDRKERMAERSRAHVRLQSIYDQTPAQKLLYDTEEWRVGSGFDLPHMYARVPTLSEIGDLRARAIRAENEILRRETSCRVCSSSFQRLAMSSVKDHYEFHRQERRSGCPYCGDEWTVLNSRERIQHIEDKHFVDPTTREANTTALCSSCRGAVEPDHAGDETAPGEGDEESSEKNPEPVAKPKPTRTRAKTPRKAKEVSTNVAATIEAKNKGKGGKGAKGKGKLPTKPKPKPPPKPKATAKPKTTTKPKATDKQKPAASATTTATGGRGRKAPPKKPAPKPSPKPKRAHDATYTDTPDASSPAPSPVLPRPPKRKATDDPEAAYTATHARNDADDDAAATTDAGSVAEPKPAKLKPKPKPKPKPKGKGKGKAGKTAARPRTAAAPRTRAAAAEGRLAFLTLEVVREENEVEVVRIEEEAPRVQREASPSKRRRVDE